ncbi:MULTISPECIES: HipA domain-containing protein [Deefgea]|uniref:Type II toxin-antitoxin system HipA family toxin n=1 Tax=Deefgea chitinilytica TaxID=570276 RepID=A0ABS2CC06_9NEIS|nr:MULTISPECIES: HipA domain-containing protein [Deefgea]MBM5571567.1 type II toxin-antitoxin system HipA family toxin [Deefgea chitinilytica]MBM9888801.1 HipA domain-containing protein [Deefgea sp. CFH1-16]
MNNRSLCASINQTKVGTLQEVAGLWSFQYSVDWLENPQGFALSPHLPLRAESLLDGASKRYVQWYFDNLLPEEGQRALLATDAKLDIADAFGLLAWYGAESAGSITLLPPDTAPQVAEPLRPLPDDALENRIRLLPKAPLTHAAIKRMSLAGAQHKLAVIFQDDKLFEPAGATPSTHILKPDHPDEDYPHSVINEWFVMRLAKRLGLDVPNVHRRYVPSPVYLIDRFDRVAELHGWQRRHVIDACQLLGLDRSFKYSQGSMENLAALANACRSPAVARSRLFGWLVFNVLVGNSDAHLKNLSFLVSHEGVQLAPFYDLLSIATYDTPAFGKQGWPAQTLLAWPILGGRYFADIDRKLLLEAGRSLNLVKGTAERLLESLRSRVVPEAEALYAEIEAENIQIARVRPELAATMAGESRCLRTILHGILKEMSKQTA